MIDEKEKEIEIDELNGFFEWYNTNFGENIQKAFDEFFGEKFQLKLISLSKNINVLFPGENYFVTKVRIDRNYDVFFRCSSVGLKIILDDVLGESKDYNISSITDLEGKLISEFNDFVYNKIIDLLMKPVKNVKRRNFDNINLTFFIKGQAKECGKFIVSIPKDLVSPQKTENPEYDITKFNQSILDTKIKLGTTIFKLKDLKSIECEDIVVLDNSNVEQMHIIYKDYEKDFQVMPRKALKLPQIQEEGEEMAEETTTNDLPQNLWDSIQVEMGAELESVKITLGELRAIAKGQVMDLSSIYNSKVSLIVENQVVAKGELVIVNDRYGVKVDEVFEAISQGEYVPPAPQAQEETEAPVQEEIPQEQAPQEQTEGQAQAGNDEEFDYSDFNIDEQDI